MTAQQQTTSQKTYLVVSSLQSAHAWAIDNEVTQIEGNPDVVLVSSIEDAQGQRPAEDDRVVCVDVELMEIYHVLKGYQRPPTPA
jgi:hypothetical protein